jgi:uncharacterized membrane protein YphA (DoxX/SURF4 family)
MARSASPAVAAFVVLFGKTPESLTSVDYVFLVLRWSLGAVLLVAGLAKLLSWRGFVSAVEAHAVPRGLSPVAATLVVIAEIAVGACLAAGVLMAVALPAVTALFASFFAVLALALIRSKEIPCYCFGADDGERISRTSLARTFALLLASASTSALYRTNPEIPPVSAWLPSAAIASTIVVAVGLVGAFPVAWQAFKVKPSLVPTPTGRRSYRHQPLSVPFVEPPSPGIAGNGSSPYAGPSEEVVDGRLD